MDIFVTPLLKALCFVLCAATQYYIRHQSILYITPLLYTSAFFSFFFILFLLQKKSNPIYPLGGDSFYCVTLNLCSDQRFNWELRLWIIISIFAF